MKNKKLTVNKLTITKLSEKEKKEIEGGQDTMYRTSIIDKLKF